MTTAIILSMGMLVESVNYNSFVSRMMMKAIEQNPKFKFTQSLFAQCIALSDSFNLGKITRETFMGGTLHLLGDMKLNTDEFWRYWNDIIKIGNIRQSLQELKKFCDANHCLVYLTSDTNTVHLEKLQAEYAAAGITLSTESNPGRFDQFPLYTSCGYGKNNFQLTQEVITHIKEKNFNKPDVTILVLGDPDNIKDAALRTANKAETKTIQQWCSENKVKLVLHKNDKRLIKTLESAVEVNNENKNTQRTGLTA